MLSFKELLEALEPMAGKDSGFKEIHKINHNGVEYHAVVNFVHHGDGNYKVVARTGEAGKVGFKQLNSLPATVRRNLATKIARSVDHFRNNNDWNSLAMGGTNRHNKEVYQRYADTVVANSSGKITAHKGNINNPLRAAVVLRKAAPIPSPRLSGHVPSSTSGYDVKKSRGGYSDGSSSSSTRGYKNDKSDAKVDPMKMVKSFKLYN